jgi:beta-glucosidase
VRRASPDGLLTSRSVDLAAQEDSRAITWTGSGSVAIEGPGGDLSRELLEGFALVLDGRIDQSPSAPVKLSFAGIERDITDLVRQPGLMRLVIPLHCFTEDKARVASVVSPFRLTTDGNFALTIRRIDVEAVADQRCR